MLRWFSSRAALEQATAQLEPMRAVVEPHLSAQRWLTGYCASCNAITRLRGPRERRRWADLRESFACEDCGLNGRGRMSWIALRDAILRAGPASRVLLLERVTPFYARVSREFPAVEGSEYLADDAAPGERRVVRNVEVRHENLMQLSCDQGSLDVIFHGDVLEHVPDDRAALAECRRVLKPGGVLLFTVPFYALEESIVRARVDHGRTVHLVAPAYHGNPMAKEGSLVFKQHGWPLLADLAACGFATVETGLLYDPFQGIVSNNNPYREGHMWPVMFRAVK